MKRKSFSLFKKSFDRFSTSSKFTSDDSKIDEDKKENSFDRKLTLDDSFENFTLINNPEYEQENLNQAEYNVEEVKSVGDSSFH